VSDRRDAWIEIDHSALRHNLAHLRAHTQPGTKICAVVKANAYGHGATEVARTLVDAGAEHLAVITLDEALALREAGIRAPILLLHEPPHSRVDEVIAADLVSVVFTPRTIQLLDEAAARAGDTARAHLKIDTGLNRQRAGEGGASQDRGHIHPSRLRRRTEEPRHR
jgi:alanine racemase